MSNQLTAQQKLTKGQQITSPNGKAYLVMQGDGNFVLYRKDNGQALWSSGTGNPSGVTGNNYAIMQTDGNLVVYTATQSALWSTQTNGNQGAYAVLDDYGNLVVYSATNAVLWTSNTVQWDFMPSSVAAHAIWPVIVTCAPGQVYFDAYEAPGWEYKLCLNGADYADAPLGLAQTTGLPMGTDTIIHVASMSKPVCVTAYVAMVDDWTELAQGVKGTGPLAATQDVEIVIPLPSGTPLLQAGQPAPPIKLPIPRPSVPVPLWLLPALSSAALAQQLVSGGLLTIVPPNLQSAVTAIAQQNGVCVPPAAVPPGYAGLLTQVIKGVAVPQPTDDFLPLIQSSLQAKATSLGVTYKVGHNMGTVTLGQLITHNSAIPDGFTDQSVLTLIPSANTVQPANGGPATCDIWAYLLAFVRQPANGQPGYKDDDYNVLGGVIAACVGTDYDDYVYARLFSDPQFSALRRYVTNPSNAAFYYSGLGPNFSPGNPFPDYRGWGASGGFYYTADQITQWLYTLYTGASVQRTTGTGSSGPLVSTTGLNTLFATTAYFTAGQTNTVSGWTTYTHNGGTSVGSGACNGCMGIAVGPSGDVMTAFFCANGSLDGDGPFNAALSSILQYSYPPSAG